MADMSENGVNRRLLVDVEAVKKDKTSRLSNITSALEGQKKRLVECVDKRMWDQALDALNQMHCLSVDAIAAENEVIQAQARVDGLQAAIVRVEEKERLAAIPAPYKPYTAEPPIMGAAPVAEPVSVPVVPESTR